MPEISVIVPVYNVEQYLQRCVDSILSQSFSDFELILVDDGSPDRCGAICDTYAEQDNRVCVIHQENGKASAARNAGIEAAKGKWIAFVDPDDWIHQHYLRLLYENTDNETDVILCDCLIVGNESISECSVENVVFHSAVLKEIENNHVAITRIWGRLIQRKALGNFRFIRGTEPAEDSCFNEFFFRPDMKFKITDAKLYYYFMRPDSAIHDNLARGALNSVEPILQRLLKIEDPEKRRRVIRRCHKYVLNARYLEMFTPDYAVVKDRCRRLLRMLRPYRKELDLKNRIIYGVLSACPQAYRLWRIQEDSTLLEYEKNEKQKLRSSAPAE